jgi:hypothetical protein
MSLLHRRARPLPEFPKFPESVGALNGKASGIRILQDDLGRFGKFEKISAPVSRKRKIGTPRHACRTSRPLAIRLKIQYSVAP